MSKKKHVETIAVHQNFRGDDTNSVVRGIHPSTAFYFNDADHGADLFNLEVAGNIYTRLTNPTNDALGNVVSDMEDGVGGLTVSSGAAAINTTILTICKSGDHIVSSKSVYGGTVALLGNTLPGLGIDITFVDQDASYEDLKKAFKPNTKVLFAEIIGNPRANILDCSKFSKLAKEHKVPFVVDNTFTPPPLFKVIDHGADIIVHSATKYLGGHGNAMCGIIVDCGTFDWNDEKYPDFHTPNEAYHGIVFTKAFGNMAFIYKARTIILRDIGCSNSPFNSFLIFQGLQTLHLRLDHVSKNALTIAKWLESHDKVKWVEYPLLESHPDYERAKEYFPKGAGGILSFGIDGDLEDSKQFINSLKLAAHAVNVGDSRTIVTHPSSTTHRQVPLEEQKAAGILENMIRLSIGLEHIEDIKDDIDQALRSIK